MKTIVVYIVFCVILLLIFWQYTQFLKKEQIKRTAILEAESKEVSKMNESLSKLFTGQEILFDRFNECKKPIQVKEKDVVKSPVAKKKFSKSKSTKK